MRGSTRKASVTDIAMDMESRSDDAPPTGAVNGMMTAQEFLQAENRSVKKPSDFAEGRGRADEARGPELQHLSNQKKGTDQDAIIATDSSSTSKSPGPSSNNDESNHRSLGAAAITTPKLTKGYYTTPSFLGSLVAIGLSAISGIGGFALPAALLTTINADIGPSASITWVSIVYLVTQTIGQLILGRLTDLFGRRWFFFGCSMLALIGSIICARAQSVNMLIGGNTIMGLASAAQMSFPYLVTEIVPINWRFFSMAYVYTIAIPFTGIGPVVADAFATHTSAGWRGIYYMFIGINVAAAICFYFFYYPPTFALKHSRDKLTRRQVLADFDYVGLVLFTGGLLVFLLGLSWGGTLHAWNSSWTIATIVVGGVAVVAFGLWEAYAPIREPLVPPHLFRSWGWVATVMVLSLGICLYYSFYLVWPSQVAVLYSDNESTSYIAWLSCAASGPYLFGTISTQLSFRAIGHAKIQVITMTISATAFIAGCASITPHNKPTVVTLLVLRNYCAGWFVGLTETLVSIIIADQAEIGVAVGVAATFRSGISTIATAVFTTVLSNRLANELPKVVAPAIVKAGLPSSSVAAYLTALTSRSASAMEAVPGISKGVEVAGAAVYKVAAAESYSTVYLVTLVFSGLALVFCGFVPDIERFMTNEVSAVISKGGEVKRVAEVEDEEEKV